MSYTKKKRGYCAKCYNVICRSCCCGDPSPKDREYTTPCSFTSLDSLFQDLVCKMACQGAAESICSDCWGLLCCPLCCPLTFFCIYFAGTCSCSCDKDETYSVPNDSSSPLIPPLSPPRRQPPVFSHPVAPRNPIVQQPTAIAQTDFHHQQAVPRVPPLAQPMSAREIIVDPSQKLGSGGFGIVYRGKWNEIDIAVKQLRDMSFSPSAMQEFKQEASLMSGLRHPHIVIMYGAIMDSEPACIVMELMTESLQKLLLDHSRAVSDYDKGRISGEIASGLNYLHVRNIVHRDLKSANVLLDGKQTAKISDFGLARIKAETGSKMYMGDAKGTPAWMAPELFKLTAKYSVYSDVYAYGMTLWEIASRNIPYEGKDAQIIIAAVKGGEREEIPSSTPTMLREIIEGCWVADPKKRLVLSNIWRQ